MARPSSEIPLHPLSDYSPQMSAGQGIYVGRFEEAISRLPNRLKMHRHEYFEVFWLEGGAEHFNDFQTFTIDEPTLIMVSPGQVHNWYRAERLRGPMVCFTQEFFDGGAPPPSPLLKHSFWFPNGQPPVLRVPEADRAGITGLFEYLEKEFQGKATRHEDLLAAVLRVLFIKIDRAYEQVAPAEIPCRASSLVREFRLSLEKNFSELTTVAAYAKQLKVTADHLSEAVKDKTGLAAGDLIRQRMLLEAQRLLAHTELAVAEIAYRLSFQDPAYFSRFFRRLTGASPGEFRERVQ
ncbi:MAG: helix-turn-helix domain-containing protein [Verrucomicrobium sp.]|nr:helix-turn-helix domain-containing protein [Verrucomicrobium sp.]